jgi:hypothetical protein
MAAVQQTAEEKAAEQAEVERIAAEATAAQVAAEEAEKASAKPAARGGLIVTGPVAVLPLKSGGERYVYRGTPVGAEFTKEGVEHAQSVGLVGKAVK